MTSSTSARSRPCSFNAGVIGFVALAVFTGGTAVAMPFAAGNLHDASNSVLQRGEVAARGRSVKAVVAGPVTIHAYSEFAGGSVYIAPLVTGTDKDCEVAADDAAPVLTRIPADRITPISAREGQVVCLAINTKGSFELLWHAVETSPHTEQVALRDRK